MGKMAGGLNNAELLKDKVATGQLIMDGTTAMSSNGRSMTLGGVLRRFRENSGEKDFDRYGYGLHGAFTGDGKTALNKDGKADTGPLAIDKQMEKTYGSKAKDYHAYSNADQTLLSANDKAQLEKDWNIVISSTNIDTLKNFIEKYPNELEKIGKINQTISKLEDKEKQEKEEKRQKEANEKWLSIKKLESKFMQKALEDFISNYPYFKDIAFCIFSNSVGVNDNVILEAIAI
jgi:hypothetical protein